MKKLIRITTVPSSLKVLLTKQLKFMSAHFEVLAVSSPGSLLAEVGQNEQVRTIPITMTRAITPVKDLVALWQLYRLFKKERPEIVHTHTPKAGLLGMMAARMAAVPVRLHTVAGMPLMGCKGIKRILLQLCERITYACALQVYPNSRSLASYISENGYCPDDKVKVLGNGSSNGIDTAYFKENDLLSNQASALKSSLSLQPSDFVFVYIGRLVKDKGIEELVNAFLHLRKQYTHIKLLLVGEYETAIDPISAEVVEHIRAESDIIQVDWQQDVRPYLLMSDVLVFPSYREGFPNVPLQAGCFHLPAIVTDINGCNEIILPRENGLVIPVKNISAIIEAMETLMTNRELYTQMRKNARKLITERYEQQKFWNILLSEYQQQVEQYARLS